VTIDDRLWVGDRTIPLAPGHSSGVAADLSPRWEVEPGLALREQMAIWLKKANDAGCGGDDTPCYNLQAPRPGDPAEPWRIRVHDSVQGDLLTALAWLRDGFWQTPKPDIEVTANNVVILTPLGGLP
jgi:hypothetical protein